MHRILPLVVCFLLTGCGEPEAPRLHLTIKRENGASSISRFRVFRTGPISESGDRGSVGAGTRQSVTIDKVADDGVTLTVTLLSDLPDAAAEE